MSSADANVSQLIRRARAGGGGGDLARLLELYRNYLKLLADAWLDTALRGKADASDVVQETLFKAHQRFGQFRGGTEPEIAVWLRQILARNLIDLARHYRKASARELSRERSLEAIIDRSSQALGKMLAGNATTPSRTAERRELAVVLADALSDLSEDYRRVIMLRNLQELEWDVVAGKMERSEGAVRMLWARALKQLRPLVETRLS